MKDIEEHKEGYQWLDAKHVDNWARWKFRPHVKCDTITNNFSESWNKLILEARDQPIITLLETIRRIVMRRLQTKRESLVKWEGKICPRIMDKLRVVEDENRQCNVHHAGDWKYEVEHNDDVWSVDLETRLCSCGQWQISGMPCIHSVAAIIKKRVHIEDYIDSCFAIETYKKTYEGLIYPVPGINQWPEVSEEEKVLSPPFRKQPGRPKKKRINAVDEDVEKKGGYRRQYKMMRCSRCKQLGHNVRGCKNGSVMETRDEDQQECGQDGGAATHGSCRPMEKTTKEGDLGLGLEWDDGGILNKLATKQFRVRKGIIFVSNS